MSSNPPLLSQRFRGYFPVVIDVETAGFNAGNDALLELAAVTVKMDDDGILHPDETFHDVLLCSFRDKSRLAGSFFIFWAINLSIASVLSDTPA